MKRFLLILSFLFASLSAMATGQEPDIVYIDGQRWWLLGRPVGADSVLYYSVINSLPKDYCESSANWDGFTVYWTIVDDQLVLDSIKYLDPEHCKETVLPYSVVRKVFGKQIIDGRIVANWLTGTIRLAPAKSTQIFYEHMGFLRNYETELFLDVDKGLIVDRKQYNNHIVKEGFYFDYRKSAAVDSLRTQFARYCKKYSELDSVDRLAFEVVDLDVDSLGVLRDIRKVVLYRPNLDEASPLRVRLEQDFRDFLMAIYPWRAWCINGRYCTLYRSFVIPIALRKDKDS